MTALLEAAHPAPRPEAPQPTLPDVLAVVREHAQQNDQAAAFPVEALAALRASRLLGLLVPAEYGGPGGTLRDLLDITQRLAREDLSVAMIFAMHCQQVAALTRHGGSGLLSRVLPRIARGEVYLASVTTERGKGGHLLTAGAGLESGRDGTMRLDRDAPIVTGGSHADGFLITMLAPGATSPTQVSLVYADREQLRVTARGQWRALGMRGSHSLPLHLTGEVAADQVVGEHGAFRHIVTEVFGPLAHLGWSASWLGAASGALSRTVCYLRSPEGRQQRDLGSELLLTRLAKVRARVDGVNALLWHTLEVCERPGADVTTPSTQLLLNALKITAAEQCFSAVDELVELAGLRHGYLADSPLWLERAFRDLRAASLNYSNDRLYLADGRLTLLDQEVRLA